MKRMHVKLTFIEPVLGTWPSNQNIAREFIASKSPDAASIEDEVAAIGADAVADKGMTVQSKGYEVNCCAVALRSTDRQGKGKAKSSREKSCKGKARQRGAAT